MNTIETSVETGMMHRHRPLTDGWTGCKCLCFPKLANLAPLNTKFQVIGLNTVRRAVAFSLLMLAVGCSDSKESRLQRFLLKGNDQAQQGNDAQAIGYYRTALELDSCIALTKLPWSAFKSASVLCASACPGSISIARINRCLAES